MLHKIAKANGHQKIKTGAEAALKVNKVRLSILTQNNIFGLIEVMMDYSRRVNSVECVSTEGECLFMSRENFLNCVNRFEFYDQVIEELGQKQKCYKDRLLQTHLFQRNFIRQQREAINYLKSSQQTIRLPVKPSPASLIKDRVEVGEATEGLADALPTN